jgi:hypothetical protein
MQKFGSDHDCLLESSLQEAIQFLNESGSLQSIERDPYWPKWRSPWWYMLLLHELDLTKKIPELTILKMVEVLKSHYLPVFPIAQDEVPAGTDPFRKIACLCAVGSIYQVLFTYGVDVDKELPWMRQWFLKYQLPDGGLNCDEAAYTKEVPKSSIVSTLSCLESVLFCRNQDLTDAEKIFLERGANYLLRHRLFRKITTGEIINQDWLEIRFPRFYDYDFLRGYYFLVKWRQQSGFTIPDELTNEVEVLVAKQMTAQGIQLKRYNLFDKRSYNPNTNESWSWGEASEFDLMKAVSFNGALCEPLTKKWNEIKPKQALVIESYETAYKNPIKLKVGESVTVEKREVQPDWLGWVYCIDSRNISGWVSENCLKESGSSVIVIKDYDATELNANSGEKLKIYFEEFGWCWCQNSIGVKGWIPAKNLKIQT